MNLSPVPSESASCLNCSAPLVADQRYCLSCGQPCSPVRLAFLDVLQTEHQPQAAGSALATRPVAYAQLQQPSGTQDWLRRYMPIFAVLSVLLLAMVIGLLVGHWVTQSKAPSTQILKVEGLTGAAPAAAAATSTTPTGTTPTSTAASTESKPSTKAEAEEVTKEAKAEKVQAAKIEHAAVIKPTSTKLKKLANTTGKKHAEEINALGAQPIETGG